MKPIPHCNEIHVPVFNGMPELQLPSSEEDRYSVLYIYSIETTISESVFLFLHYLSFFLANLIKDLNLTKDLNLFTQSSKMLASRLKEKN